MILIVAGTIDAQTTTQSLEIPIYSNNEEVSKTVDSSSDVETDEIDIYTVNENKAPLFTQKKQNKFGVYGILYGEPEKIKLPTVDSDDVGIGIGVEFNF